MGEVELIGKLGEKSFEDSFVPERGVDPLSWDGEVGTGRVTDYDGSLVVGSLAVQLFVGFIGGRVNSIDSVAVGVNTRVSRVGGLLSSWVDIGVRVITIVAFPVVASESGELREGIIVEVEEGDVVVSKSLDEI